MVAGEGEPTMDGVGGRMVGDDDDLRGIVADSSGRQLVLLLVKSWFLELPSSPYPLYQANSLSSERTLGRSFPTRTRESRPPGFEHTISFRAPDLIVLNT
jgi:hypothetical protein